MNRFERLHALLSQKPRANLGFFPTPLVRLNRLSEQLGVNLYVKRDDFSGMSLFGGNKIRKLEYLLGDAREKGCDTVFTYGATQSNHAMQTVTACRRLGMEPILYLNAYVQPDENDIRANMLLDRILGAQVNVIPGLPGETEAQTEERCHQLGLEHAARLEKEGHRCYDVPMGGAIHLASATPTKMVTAGVTKMSIFVSLLTALPHSAARIAMMRTASGPPAPPSALAAQPTAAREKSTIGSALSA